MLVEPNHLSLLGIVHTSISILAIVAAIVSLLRYGKISPSNLPGNLYIVLTIITCLTALPIMKTGHPTAGHPVAVIILILLPIGAYARSIPFFKKSWDYVQIIAMSTTVFLSMVPATVETLTRVPISKPIASGPNDPIVQMGLLVMVIFYIAGTTYQVVKLKKSKKKTTGTSEGTMSLN